MNQLGTVAILARGRLKELQRISYRGGRRKQENKICTLGGKKRRENSGDVYNDRPPPLLQSSAIYGDSDNFTLHVHDHLLWSHLSN